MCYLKFGLFAVLMWLSCLTVKASEINLLQVQTPIQFYAEPNAGSKIVTTITKGNLLVIFDHKDWVKVADPKTGAVGWVHRDKLNQASSILLVTQAGSNFYAKTPNGTMQYIMTQSSDKVDDKEIKKITQQMDRQAVAFKRSFNQLFEMNMRYFNETFKLLSRISNPTLVENQTQKKSPTVKDQATQEK
jgi:hypothetical protein